MKMFTSRKKLKIAIALAIFSGVSLWGFFSSQYVAKGEEALMAEEESILQENYDSSADPNECIDQDIYGNCDEIELPYDLKEEVKIYPTSETRPQITWQKNAVKLGNFTPDAIYVLRDAGSYFEIIETEMIPNDDGQINLIAFGMDENDNDYYSFHMSYAVGGADWKGEFVQFITNFKN